MRFFRSAAIPLALASLLGSLRPAAAVDLTNYTPFVANITCPVVFQNGAATTCQGAVNLPTNREIVLEYISFSCTGIPPAIGRLFAANVETQVGGVTNVQFLDLPVASC